MHLRDAYETTMDPARRAEVATMLARTLVFAGGPGEATAFARSAAAALPADLDDARQGLLALERIGGYMHGLPEQEWQRRRRPGLRARARAPGCWRRRWPGRS